MELYNGIPIILNLPFALKTEWQRESIVCAN